MRKQDGVQISLTIFMRSDLRMQVFIMIPYQPQFDNLYNAAIKPAIEDAGLKSIVVKDEPYIGAIFEKIQESKLLI